MATNVLPPKGAEKFITLTRLEPGDVKAAPNGEDIQPIVLKVFNGRDLALSESPPREWEILDVMPAARVTRLSGDGAGGKSLLAEQLGIAVASGTDWIGKLPRKGKCLYLSCEDDK